MRHSYHPHTAVLIETEEGIWRLTPAIPGAITQPGLVIYRFGASLFYANANLFSEEILSLVKDAPSPVRWVVVDAGAIASVDYTAAWIVRKLQQELSSRGTELVFAHVQSDLTPDLERHHLAGAPGQIRIFTTLHEMLEAFAKHEKTL